MSHKNACLIGIIFILLLLSCAVGIRAQSTNTAQPSQVDLGDVKGAVVTLYYFDPATGGKGDMVKMPENPQEVQWDYTKAAPGTYVFYHVPQGTYYVEAVHDNHTWFAVVTVDQGTSTANVAIPPYNDSGFIATPSPETTPSPSPSPVAATVQAPSPDLTPSPGMTTLSALTGLMLVAVYVVLRKK